MLTGAGIQLDQPMGDTAVHEPDVSIRIKAGILAVASDPIPGMQGIVGPPSWRVRGQVVLNVHGLAESLFIDGHLLLDSDSAAFTIGSEVLDSIGHQVIPVLPRKAKH